MDQKPRAKIIKLLEGNTGENLYDPGLGNSFLKALAINKKIN